MTRFFTALVALWMAALAGPATALSCVKPDVARTYQELDAASETYVAVHGRLFFDPAGLPEGGAENQQSTPASTELPAWLSGRSLSPAGFVTRFEKPIVLDVRCLGPWCPSAEPGAEVLAFVEAREGGHVLVLDPCYGKVFFEPGEQMLERAASCMRGEGCAPDSDGGGD